MSQSRLEKDAADLFAVMTAFLRQYQFRDRDHMGYHGLTITQSYVMEIVIRRRAITLNDLATEMNLDKSTMSRVVDGLERKGAIRRKANPDDGRSMLIRATALGKTLRRQIAEDLIAENAKILASFPARVRRDFVRMIAALTEAVRTRHIERVAEDALPEP